MDDNDEEDMKREREERGGGDWRRRPLTVCSFKENLDTLFYNLAKLRAWSTPTPGIQ